MSSIWDRLDAPTRALLDGYGGEGVVVVRPSLCTRVRTLVIAHVPSARRLVRPRFYSRPSAT
jgi:hypothetical protein